MILWLTQPGQTSMIIMKKITFICFYMLISSVISAQTPFVTADTYDRGGSYAEDNFGADNSIYVKSSPTSEEYSRRGYLKFDVSGISIDKILRAEIQLFAEYVHDDMQIGLYSIPDNWEENTLTWSNAPEMGERLLLQSIEKADEGTWIHLDVTAHLINQGTDGFLSVGIEDPFQSNNHTRFTTKEAGTNIPLLVISEATQIPVAPSDLKVRVLTPRQAELTWADQAEEESFYIIESSPDGINYVAYDTVPANTEYVSYSDLMPSTTHFFRVRAMNGMGSSEPSNEAQLITPPLSDQYTYYIDATGGDDSNDGTSENSSFRSFEVVNRIHFLPGSQVLFKKGEEWTGSLVIHGSGEPGKPNLVGAYGEGDAPLLNGPGTYQSNTVYFDNVSYWEMEGLRIRNFEVVDEGMAGVYKRGIYVRAHEMGAVNHFVFRNLEIHDINAQVSDDQSFSEISKNYGGIFMEITGDAIPTWFDTVIIEDSYFHDLGRTGFSNASSWERRGLLSEFGDELSENTYDNYVPSRNMVFRNNRVERTEGNGLILRIADKPLIEYNYFYNCATTLSGNAAFCFNTDSALFQFNEASYTVYNEGDTDARGIDSDFRTKYTIIQYNYLHHNGYGGVVATGGPGGTTSVPRFNDGTIIRYNILVDNESHIVRTSGVLSNLFVYNNVFYTGESLDNIIQIYNGAWAGAAANGSYYYNNVFYSLGSNPTYDFGQSRNNVFSNNAFYGNHTASEPPDPEKVLADPAFVDPGPAENIESLDGFMIQPGSPLRGAGFQVEGMPEQDFFGNPVTGSINIGVHQTLDNALEVFQPGQAVRLFPNPVRNILNITADHVESGTFTWSVLNTEGKVVARGDGTVNENRLDFCLQTRALGLDPGYYILRLQGSKVACAPFTIQE